MSSFLVSLLSLLCSDSAKIFYCSVHIWLNASFFLTLLISNTNTNNNNNNILKYKDLTIEIQCMWNVKARVIPVIIGATGTISKPFRKYVSSIPGNHEVRELQKTAILGTAHILRKVLT
jgi:hypothetical protein